MFWLENRWRDTISHEFRSECPHCDSRRTQVHRGRFFRSLPLLFLLPFSLSGQAIRQHEVPLKNWEAPLYWQPELTLQASGPSAPAVFVAITRCRVVDTRGAAGFPSPFGAPSLTAGGNRTFPVQSSTLCSIPSTA